MTMDRLPPFIAPLAGDQALQARVAAFFEAAYVKPDALDLKTKFLIGLALDIAVYSAGGVRNIAMMAREQGATEEEILSVLNLCFAQAGFARLVPALVALDRKAGSPS
jgi:alkylhydroperoxidase/carboxymuconolactone decarboxylase family protein YurZ